MFVYALTIFIGAFLLFQVQPLIGKYILPWFGGGPGVWTTCLLFFQMLLLAGYAYAHGSARWFKPRIQAVFHLVLLTAALALLPVIPADAWKPAGGGDPTLQILGLLAACVGLPYFVLSATGPLMQHWFSRTHPGVSPYRLYALSNVGSLLALVSYPVYFETQFTRQTQAALWGWGLIAYAIGCAACAVKLWRAPQAEGPGEADATSQAQGPKSGPFNPQPSTLNRLLWLLLPACASMLLVATTNRMCQEVAVIPFLWVLPLALYLLSFIICFDNPRWYVRPLFIALFLAGWGGICWVLFKDLGASLELQLGIYSAGLFVACMVCHGELYRLRPDPRQLTGFYLMIAAGGALGGLFVAVIAPLIFNDYFELHWGLFLCGLLLLIICIREWQRERSQRWRIPTFAGVLAGLVASGLLWQHAHRFLGTTVYKSRNFYGVLKVYDANTDQPRLRHLQMFHGRIMHGQQFTDPGQAAWPTTYFSEKSGVGLALAALPAGQRRIGVIGLGVGTLAAYGRPGDTVHFYEINPEVERLAYLWFTYLTNCMGTVNVTLGDARLSLEQEPPQDFDLLVLDAFNSDAIPVHLLTEEAFAMYQRHLKTNGIIAAHVSTRALNLEPVVANLARHFNYEVTAIENIPPTDQPWNLRSVWMLLSRSGEIINSRAIRVAARPANVDAVKIPLWTDDFTSLFQIRRSETQPHSYLDPDYAAEQTGIATTLCQQGNFAGAIGCYRQALQQHPNMWDLQNNLAWVLATCPEPSLRNGPEAVQLAEKACQLTHYNTPLIIGTLAAAYAEAGRFDDAVWMGEKACALALEQGEQALWKRNRELLELYRAHTPYHEAR